jgi:hypothetical protein
MDHSPDFDAELKRLNGHLPDWAASLMYRAMEPSATWIRVPAGLALMGAGTIGFLPILGFWMIPLGLALVARDVPFMRPPLARGLALVNRKLESLRNRR